MANTSLVISLCLFLLLLLLAVAGNTVAVTTPWHGHGNVGAATPAMQMPPKYDDDAVLGRGAAGVTTVPPADDDNGCWESVVGTSPPCARDVLLSLVLHAPRLSGECCTVLARAGDKCVAGVFSGLPSGEKYLPLVKREKVQRYKPGSLDFDVKKELQPVNPLEEPPKTIEEPHRHSDQILGFDFEEPRSTNGRLPESETRFDSDTVPHQIISDERQPSTETTTQPESD
uniref:Prolamin-like domain-containing protein n=1 Tax=Oryza punctata TaxID=4537 RepID=A0A0E0LWE8_ORYPU